MPVSSTGNVYDSTSIEYFGNSSNSYLDIYHKVYGAAGTIEITRFDTTNKIFSGIFNFILSNNEQDSVVITDGRFDFQLQDLCTCSN